MPTYQLFRIKAVFPRQLRMGAASPSAPRASFIRAAIEARPSAQLGRQRWRIGNIEQLDSKADRFAFGRQSSSKLEVFDGSSGDFSDALVENAPYTQVVIDYDIQICAIASKSRLGAPNDIARRLAQLLNKGTPIAMHELDIEIDPMRDPLDLVTQIENAYRIRTFVIEFSLPNPFDSEEDFQAPAQRLLQATGGDRGSTRLDGSNLAPEPLAELTRAAAAYGNNAEAILQTEPSKRWTRKDLRHSKLVLTTEEEDDVARMRTGLLQQMRELYRKLRG